VEYRRDDPNRVLACISHPVGILTVRRGEKINGMTVAWFSQISMNPPMVAVAVSPKRYTWELLKDEDHFGLSLLNEEQEDICELFGTVSGRSAEKFNMAGIEPFVGEASVPLIPGALAAGVFKKEKVIETGDHLLIVGRCIAAYAGEGEPLNWYQSSVRKCRR